MKKLYTYLLVCLASFSVFASVKQLSPATKIWIQNHEELMAKAFDTQCVEAFVSFNSPEVIARLEQAGAKVNSVFSDFATVTIPLKQIHAISDLKGVNEIDVSHQVRLLSGCAATSTGAVMANEGYGLESPFTGKGVVVGVVDTGIDFNHRAFLDSDLKNRIKRVYIPSDNSGTPVLGFPGSEYADADIQNLIHDANTSHGTHTTAIAAGSILSNAYDTFRGMAPEADIVVCALGNDMSEVHVVDGVRYIAQYAASLGNPCVINLSLGNHDGPHDGTGFMARAFDEIADTYPHTVICVAAGNEGAQSLYLHKTISASRPLSSFLSYPLAEVDAWSNTTHPFSIQLHIFDKNSQSIIYSTDVLQADTTFSVYSNEYFSQVVTSGDLSISFGSNDVTGHTRIYFKSSMRMKSGYVIGVSYHAADEMDLRVWECTGSSSFQSYGVDGFTAGSAECAISDMATGQRTISVGSYVNRNSHSNYLGNTVSDTNAPIGSISSFSSSGVDVNGVSHPFITAPGTAVVSAVNSNLGYKSSYAMVQPDATGRDCYWGVMSGTSMATPCVSGIVALWLQANPLLTIDQVKQVMANSANKTGITADIHWGNGKIDAYQGLVEVLSSGLSEQSIFAQQIVMMKDAHYLYLSTADSSHITATLFDINGKQIHTEQGMQSVSFSVSSLPKGVYIVKAVSHSAGQSFKVLIP
ncbi:MAG: S8 family peptidase [Sodaliphilus sp.]